MTPYIVDYTVKNWAFCHEKNGGEAQWAIADQQPLIDITNGITEGVMCIDRIDGVKHKSYTSSEVRLL